MDDDEALESLWNSERSLSDIVDAKNFKSYDELKSKLYRVLALGGGQTANTITANEIAEVKQVPTPQAAPFVAPAATTPWDEQSNDDEEDGLSFFKKLADN